MPEPTEVESLQEVMAVAREVGATDRQVRRWIEKGLLPRMVARIGKGRGVGSSTFYPAGTCAQLQAVTRWAGRSLDTTKWAVWCEGFPVEPDFHEQMIGALREAQEDAKAQIRAFDSGDPRNAIDELEAAGRMPRGQRWLEVGGRHGHAVALLSEVLRTAAEGHRPIEPLSAQEIGSNLWTIIPRIIGATAAEQLGEITPAENEAFINEVLRAWDVDRLISHLTRDRLDILRRRSMSFYHTWAPHRAEREPLPTDLMLWIILFDALGLQIGEIIDHLMNHPEGAEMGRMLRDSLLGDSK